MSLNFLNQSQLPLLVYSISQQPIYDSKSIVLDPFCNSWTVVNLGDVWVTVNGMLLKGYPVGHPELTGSSIGATGNYGEIYRGLVNVNSAESTTGSGTTEFFCLFIQKIYSL
jgi:hypothetical protein